MIKIIGTTHLMSEEEIFKQIEKENPDIVCTELCETRYKLIVEPKLLSIEEQPKEKEDNSLIGKISNLIKGKAKEENLDYGSDQISACKYAMKNNLPLLFIDLPIEKTKELMENIPKNELEGFTKEMEAMQNQTLKEVTKDIDVDKTLKELKERFPVSFEFLINMRNLYIINNLLKLQVKHPDKTIVAVLGKGHIKQVERGIQID